MLDNSEFLAHSVMIDPMLSGTIFLRGTLVLLFKDSIRVQALTVCTLPTSKIQSSVVAIYYVISKISCSHIPIFPTLTTDLGIKLTRKKLQAM